MAKHRTNKDKTSPKIDFPPNYPETIGASCFSGVPSDLLDAPNAHDLNAAVDEVDAQVSSMLGDAQKATSSGEDLPEVEALLALSRAIGEHAIPGNTLAYDDLTPSN